MHEDIGPGSRQAERQRFADPMCSWCYGFTGVLDEINAKYGTKFKMPVVYYSTLLSVAYGKSAKQAALDGHIIRAKELEEIAGK